MPLASVIGPTRAAVLWASGTAVVYRAAATQSTERDAVFAALNGFYVSAVIAHFTAWPKATRLGVPWLTECEGLNGRVIWPYNVILYGTAVAGFRALATENRRGGFWGYVVPMGAVPLLILGQRGEFIRLVSRARREPRWWNRRLQDQPLHGS